MTDVETSVRAIVEEIVDSLIAENPEALAAFAEQFGADPDSATAWVTYELSRLDAGGTADEAAVDEAEDEQADDTYDYGEDDLDLDALFAESLAEIPDDTVSEAVEQAVAEAIDEEQAEDEDLGLTAIFGEITDDDFQAEFADDEGSQPDAAAALEQLLDEGADETEFEDFEIQYGEVEMAFTDDGPPPTD